MFINARTRALLGGLIVLLLVPTHPVQASEDDLATARAATEKYWDVAVAITDGYVESSTCRSAEAGTEGIVYTYPLRVLEPDVDVERPQALIYMPEGAGSGRRLAAVEYSVPVLEDGQQRPELFGRPFDGPVDGLPGFAQYRLRAWLFSPNPEGMFAVANPAEACTGADLVAPHASGEDCHEVHSFFRVEPALVAGSVPDEFTLQTDDRGAQIAVRTGYCQRYNTPFGAKADTLFTIFDALVQPPDWVGDDVASLYLFGVATDHRGFVDWAHQETGAAPDVVAYSDALEWDLDPIVGGSGDYVFRSPDFVLEAKVTGAVPPSPAHLPPLAGRAWFETPRGMGYAKIWHFTARAGLPVEASLTPTPGTAMAEMLGCAPGAESCPAVRADEGLVMEWDRNAVHGTVSQDWWNPRHDWQG